MSVGVAVAVVAGILIAVRPFGSAPQPAPSPVQPVNTVVLGSVTANDHGSEDVVGRRDVDVEAGDHFFAPTVITGRRGRPVRLQVTSTGTERHNLSVTEPALDQDLEPGETIVVRLRFPDDGMLVFRCRYHGDLGMAGALVGS